MRYVSKDGLMEYMGEDFARFISLHPNCETVLEDCETRMLAYIVPNSPVCEEQKRAVERAVYAQVAYENSDANAQLMDVPSGLAGFTSNGFSATFAKQNGDAFFGLGLCKQARAELLLCGLLYRGVISC